VRKLTPRKASFANLFKGKGWNKNDDAKPADVPEHIRELREIVDQPDDIGVSEDSEIVMFSPEHHAR
jgi:hypothetical protein